MNSIPVTPETLEESYTPFVYGSDILDLDGDQLGALLDAVYQKKDAGTPLTTGEKLFFSKSHNGSLTAAALTMRLRDTGSLLPAEQAFLDTYELTGDQRLAALAAKATVTTLRPEERAEFSRARIRLAIR